MGIAFDSSIDGGGTNSLTFAFNNVAGNILFVGIVGDGPDGADDITTVTYNSVGCTFLDKSVTGSPQNPQRMNYLYILQNPSTGLHDVVVNCTSTHYLLCGAISYSGAAIANQPDAEVVHLSSGAATTLSTALISVANNCWHMLFDEGNGADLPATAGASTTRRVYDATFGTWGFFDSNAVKTPAGSVTLTTDRPDSVDPMSHIMASFAPTPITIFKKRITSKALRMKKSSLQPSRGMHVSG